MSNNIRLGLRTCIYPVPDLAAAKAWYARAFGVEPYFDEPFYVGFEIGGYELGLIPAQEGSQRGSAGGLAYWGVEGARAAWDLFLERGATPVESVHEVGGGILVATVRDPFGNDIGLIENPHFKLPRPG